MTYDYQIIFEDDGLIVVNKPAGLLSVPDRFEAARANLSHLLREKYGEVWKVHRLDRWTSGVMVFAKNSDAHRAMNKLFETHKVEKRYHAIVQGRPSQEDGLIDLPIGELGNGVMRIDKAQGKPSQTRYRVIETFGRFSMVEARPLTGRTHQIRIHMKAIGHPLAVDDVYGDSLGIFLSQIKPGYQPKPGEEERPIIRRLTLHAAAIEFDDYRDGRRLKFEAAEPKDFSSLVKQLRKYR